MSSRVHYNYYIFRMICLAIVLADAMKPVQGASLRKPRMIWENFENPENPDWKFDLPVRVDLSQLNATEVDNVKDGITELQCRTCLDFIIVDEPVPDDPKVLVINRTTGIGYSYAEGNIVSYEELTRNTIIHEILHAMGAYHTMQRPDRDEYIKIITDNATGFNYADQETILEDGLTFGLPYEYDSVMHFPNEERYKVLKEPIAENQAKMGLALTLTENDVKSIQAAYCDNSTDTVLEPDNPNCIHQAEHLKIEEAELKAQNFIPDLGSKNSSGTTENDAIVEAQEPKANTTEDGGSGDDGEAMESDTTVDPETAGTEGAEGDSGVGDTTGQ